MRTKEEIDTYNKKYRENHKDHIKDYYQKNKEVIKEKNALNKENISLYHKKYYEGNKDRIHKISTDWMATKVTCTCGKEICRGSLKYHKTTDSHLDKETSIFLSELPFYEN